VKKLFLVLVSLVSFSCNNVSTNGNGKKINETFDELLKEALNLSHDQMVGVSMSVLAPDLNINYQGAAGFDSKKKETKLLAEQPFRIASVTKTFVATAILLLHEKDSLDINNSINKYVSPKHIQLLKNGGYRTSAITIKHCLQHTSGLFDYAMGSNTYSEMVIKNPKRKWSRTDQIKLAMDIGEPYASPGELFHYSDTGYILLGEIIENITRTNLGESLRELLKYDSQNISSTWLENFESNPNENNPFVNRYIYDYNATEWDASIDLYGGGGLISITQDLSVFAHNLFNGNIFEKTITLKTMLSEPEVKTPNKNTYHCGLYSTSLYGEMVYMHKGMWGTILLHVPKYNCSIAINYANTYHDRLLKKAVLAIKNIHENE